jgi:2-polyprenyl-3-methyl-5-hydroxy-6-metoxy-1,4-benzoquinol methylase
MHYGRVTARMDSRTMLEFAREYETQYGHLIRSLPPGSKILDLGCGPGFLLSWLATIPALDVVGVDASFSQLAIARKSLPPSVNLVCELVEDLIQAQPGRFSVIFALNILEHIPGEDDLLHLVEHIREALVPGGLFICSVPNAASIIGGHSRYFDLTHVRAFTTSSLLQLFEAAGLERCHIKPRKATHLSQALRMWIEHQVHCVLFRLCGRAPESDFSKDLIGVAYRRGASS